MELKPLTNDQSFLKMGILGFTGSGKTFTAACVAIGLHRLIKSQKPVAIFDTETGSSYIAQNFEQAKVPAIGVKKRSFPDLLEFTKTAEKYCDIAIVDSISHPYTELVKGYMIKLNRDRLRIWDWAPIKAEWGQFSELFVNSKMHFITCGRAAWDYDDVEDEDGVTKSQKTGTHMKTESEFGYEPGLTVEMERVREKGGKVGQAISQRAWIIKDRFNVIQGTSYAFPTEKNLEKAVEKTFRCFLPHVEKLSLGKEYGPVDVETKSQALFRSPEARSNMNKRREIAIESLEIECNKRWSSRSDTGQKARIQALEKYVGSASKAAIAGMSVELLEQAVKEIRELEIPTNA